MWSTGYSTQRPQAAPPGYWYVPVRATAAGSLRTSWLVRNEYTANGSFWTAPPAACSSHLLPSGHTERFSSPCQVFGDAALTAKEWRHLGLLKCALSEGRLDHVEAWRGHMETVEAALEAHEAGNMQQVGIQ